ncbi:Gfo/Idh/MocA family oxidoreductase [Thermobrachium celere]|uniref:Gfo/Idh/MocA family oxidoreductase n=1 Tax=Thermobrachium celere TaxID=53422 RepID=UPI001A52D6AA|nr:Gfo/Idh/MocA family oxidoreductase [Thermobrachium celere]GFR34228.1 oxidoreductase [Thermobrachium celere]
MKTINVGLIGFGLSGQVFHAPIIDCTEGYLLKKIYTKNENNIEVAKKRYSAEVCSNVDDILNSDDIDLVVVATPNESHYEYAKMALLKGKHVVVEKPFTVTTKQAEDLINISKEQGKILSVYQNRRYDSDFKTVKKVIESGVLGKIVEFEAHFDRFRNFPKNYWREENIPGSGILYDLGSHLIDQALYLFGTPNKFFADVRKQRSFAKIDDSFELILFYDDLKVILKASMLVKEPLPKYVITGENGNFVKYGMDVQEEYLRKGFTPNTYSPWGKEPETSNGILNINLNGVDIRATVQSECGDYREYYKELYSAIVEGGKVPVSAEEARNTIYIIESATQVKCDIIHFEPLK